MIHVINFSWDERPYLILNPKGHTKTKTWEHIKELRKKARECGYKMSVKIAFTHINGLPAAIPKAVKIWYSPLLKQGELI